jgi:hypothetical protein
MPDVSLALAGVDEPFEVCHRAAWRATNKSFSLE